MIRVFSIIEAKTSGGIDCVSSPPLMVRSITYSQVSRSRYLSDPII